MAATSTPTAPRDSFYKRYGYWIILITMFLGPIVAGGSLRSLRTNKNEVKEWLPANYQETRDFDWFLKHFHGGQFVLLSWDGCTLEDDRLKLLAEKLLPPREKRIEGEARLFERIVTGSTLLKQLTDAPNNLKREEALKRLRGSLIGADDSSTCALITFTAEGEKNPRATLQKIIDTARVECSIPEQALHMGGPPVDNVALDVAGENSLMRLAGLTGVVGLFISWWCLRSFKLIGMVFFAALYSAGASLAVVWYGGGQMNSILLTMPSLVYVAAMSGAIHLSNYYREEAHDHGVDGAAGRAMKSATVPLVLATLTTAAGLISVAWTTSLVPIQMFGVYSGIGVIISAVVLFLVLPAALELFPLPPKSPAAGGDSNSLADWVFSDRWGDVARWILRHNVLVSAVCLAVMVGTGWGIWRTQTSVKLLNFFQPGSDIVQDYTWLEEHIGPLIPMEVVLRFNKAECQMDMVDRLELTRQVEDALRDVEIAQTLPGRPPARVGSVMSAATFSPKPKDAPRVRGLGRVLLGNAEKRQRDVYNRQLEKHRGELALNDQLSEDKTEEVWRISARVGALPDIDYGLLIAEFRQRVEPLLQAKRDAGVRGIDVTYTGLVPLVDKSQRELFSGMISGFQQDIALVIVVLMLMVRDLGAGVIVLVPAIFPAVVVFGLMGWCGVVVDVGTVMPPCVALGVTVDDVVHFLLWFRRGISQGMTRQEAVMLAYKDCARPMYQSWGVIGLGLSIFSLSPFTPTQRFGMLMVTLLTASMFGNLILLPALLAGPLGWLCQPFVQWRNRQARLAGKLPGAQSASVGAPPVAASRAEIPVEEAHDEGQIVQLPHLGDRDAKDKDAARGADARSRPDAAHRSLRSSR